MDERSSLGSNTRLGSFREWPFFSSTQRRLFSSLGFVLVGLRPNVRFSTDLESLELLEEYSKNLFDPGEF